MYLEVAFLYPQEYAFNPHIDPGESADVIWSYFVKLHINVISLYFLF